MPKIYYRIKGGVGEMVKQDPVRNKRLEISIFPADSGRVKIGDSTYTIKDGEAVIDTQTLADGTYIPKVYTKSGEAALEAIKKKGFSITPERISEEVARRLLLRVYALEDRAEKLEAIIADLKEKVDRPLKF